MGDPGFDFKPVGHTDEITPTPELVRLYEAALREAYLNLRKKHDPEFRRVSARYSWAAAADALCRWQCDPYDYVDYVFSEVKLKHSVVHASFVVSLDMVQRYLDNKGDREEFLQQILIVQARTFKEEMQKGREPKDILMDPSVAMSGLFRAVTAYAMGHAELLPHFRESATEMLLFKPVYKKLFEGRLPPELANV